MHDLHHQMVCFSFCLVFLFESTYFQLKALCQAVSHRTGMHFDILLDAALSKLNVKQKRLKISFPERNTTLEEHLLLNG